MVSEGSDRLPPSGLPDPAGKRKLLDAIRDGIEQHRALLDAFHAESDRGAILVATSLLDTTLEKIFRKVFVSGFNERLLAHDGAAGTFSSRIDLAFAMGLIHEANTAEQLHRMRRIRNACAHSLETVTFNTQQVRDLTNAMNVASSGDAELFVPKELRGQQTAPAVRARFLAHAALVYGQLYLILKSTEGMPSRAPLWLAKQLGHEQAESRRAALAAAEAEAEKERAALATERAAIAAERAAITAEYEAIAKDLADREGLPLDEARQRITAMRKRLIDQPAGQVDHPVDD